MQRIRGLGTVGCESLCRFGFIDGVWMFAMKTGMFWTDECECECEYEREHECECDCDCESWS